MNLDQYLYPLQRCPLFHPCDQAALQYCHIHHLITFDSQNQVHPFGSHPTLISYTAGALPLVLYRLNVQYVIHS